MVVAEAQALLAAKVVGGRAAAGGRTVKCQPVPPLPTWKKAPLCQYFCRKRHFDFSGFACCCFGCSCRDVQAGQAGSD